MTLTPKQLALLDLIREMRMEEVISPTLEELADAMGVSKVTIFEKIGELERKGFITRRKHEARSIELTRAGEAMFSRLPCPVAVAVRKVLDAWVVEPGLRGELEAALAKE